MEENLGTITDFRGLIPEAKKYYSFFEKDYSLSDLLPWWQRKTHQITLRLETYLGYLQRSYQRFRRLPEGGGEWKMGSVWFPKKQSWRFRADWNSKEFKRFHLLLKNVKPIGIHRFLDPCFNSCSLFHFLHLIPLALLVIQILSYNGYLLTNIIYFHPYAPPPHDAQRYMLLLLQFVQRYSIAKKANKDKASNRITKHSFKNSDFFLQ